MTDEPFRLLAWVVVLVILVAFAIWIVNRLLLGG
jgi:hypothetical protein